MLERGGRGLHECREGEKEAWGRKGETSTGAMREIWLYSTCIVAVWRGVLGCPRE